MKDITKFKKIVNINSENSDFHIFFIVANDDSLIFLEEIEQNIDRNNIIDVLLTRTIECGYIIYNK